MLSSMRSTRTATASSRMHAELTAYNKKEYGDTEEDAKKEAKSMIERFDANKDGKISKEEFLKGYE